MQGTVGNAAASTGTVTAIIIDIFISVVSVTVVVDDADDEGI